MKSVLLFISVAVSTFVIGLWGARGFPIPFIAATPMQARVDSTFGNDKSEQIAQQRQEQAVADPDNGKRNPLRMDALQAATGFTLSPCNPEMKAKLVAATTAYAAAYRWRDTCNPMFGNCEPAIERANVMYSSPLDKRVRAALNEAFEKGGITGQDFPPNLQMEVMSLANSQGNPVSACTQTSERRMR
ncbi:hypothetical protein RPMA_21895 [Tardiphaga alba]|uniref:Uncharacterized protein n=1 Tax=Tardiphaga alba TaxID=340268 RepID=A0ABX8ACB3_9BRAD|nr:hypothetical protein [Tardiphaga alba]QUS41199.1 hypothetical protein RPMA_21895 [Tardiphaga alba]